ncbi:MAG TPA: molybdenum cofactor biosynthesis protein MoaE [Polyangiaceae bacterium]
MEAVTLFAVEKTPLDLARAVKAVSHSGAGGVATFLGVVRDSNDGKEVLRLEYQAYDAMAVKEMERIASEISAEIPGVRLAALHRVGLLEVGDLAVVCAASAPHRHEAFVACRLLIDRIKERVPVWKREHYVNGTKWIRADEGWEDARCAPAGGNEPGAHHRH